jgi:hypothetical protein
LLERVEQGRQTPGTHPHHFEEAAQKFSTTKSGALGYASKDKPRPHPLTEMEAKAAKTPVGKSALLKEKRLVRSERMKR